MNGKPVVHKLYPEPYMDLFNSGIVRFHIGQTPSAAGIQSASEEAVRVTADCVMENFFGLLKQEIYDGRVYHSYEELKTAIEEYIVYYNEHRIKESLGWLSPKEYRRRHCAV